MRGVNTNLSFANGDSLQIWKVDQAMDQPGRARGSLLAPVGFSSGSLVPPSGWNDQVTETCYSWNNIREGGAHVNFENGQQVIRENEHYFNDKQMPGYTPYVYRIRS